MRKNINKVASDKILNSHWKEIINFAKIKKGGVDIDKLLSAMTIKRRSDNTYSKF